MGSCETAVGFNILSNDQHPSGPYQLSCGHSRQEVMEARQAKFLLGPAYEALQIGFVDRADGVDVGTG